jgi:hypothetical protein
MTNPHGFVLAGLLLCVSCTTTRPVSGVLSLPKDTPQVCAKHCDSIGMRLAAVVIISSSEGCVCEPNEGARATAREGAAAAGIAPILAAAAAAAAGAQQQQQQQRHGSTGSGWQPPPPVQPPPPPPTR